MFQLQLSSLNCKGSPACTIYAGTNTMDSGFPIDWFCETVPEDLICEICGKVLNAPKETRCGHNFCQRCLEFWIEYYGICPKRCGEIDLESIKKENKLEKRIMSLPVYCKYKQHGCESIVLLADKQRHEKKCPVRPKAEKNAAILEQTSPIHERKVSSISQDTYVEMASGVAPHKTTPASTSHETSSPPAAASHLHPFAPLPGAAGQLAYYTYHLKRRTPGESFGFILVAGAKNSNGKAVNFSIKTVTSGTVAAEVGLLPGDKILQVDNIGLSQLAQQEAVSRIKDNPEVILTVLRARRNLEHHVYEDILYSDGTNQENSLSTRDRTASTGRDMIRRKKSDPLPERIHNLQQITKSPTQTTVCSDPTKNYIGSSSLASRHLAEKVSADSGLSSSTGSFSDGRPRRHTDVSPHHYRHTEASSRGHDQQRRYLHSSSGGSEGRRGSRGASTSDSLRTEGDYEVEEIFLQKNGTNQLGITLGYDTNNPAGSLYVCEVISTGLAAKDGRIKKGDVIKKVNGFDVYDPEEAVLLFLEQDQDISLTVARKIKYHHYRKGLLSSRSQSSLNSPLLGHHHLELTEMRRTDSCGSLDSHTHRQKDEQDEPDMSGRRHSESVSSTPRRRVLSPVGHRNPPSSSSIGSTGIETSSIGTDFVFRPIKEGRPSTAGPTLQGSAGRLLRSSTSLGSAPPEHRGVHHPLPPGLPYQQQPMTRHQSLEARRLRSISPCKTSFNSVNGGGGGVSGNYRPREVLSPRSHQVAPAQMYRSVSTFRCESLV